MVAVGFPASMGKPGTAVALAPMSRARPRPQPAATGGGDVRIIGGRFRGSRLPVPNLPGLRPSSDRMRETLFNWLQFELAGAQALDLFAGSGALGFEAASRGAAQVLMIEREPAVAAGLRASAQRLGAAVEVLAEDALAWLARPALRRFDLVFVDPPFAGDLLPAVLTRLPAHLAERAWVYVESAPGQIAALPPGWQMHRELSTRHAHGRLFRLLAPSAPLQP
jgi:16S rRNA (guanine966-N2)-methyltransferase